MQQPVGSLYDDLAGFESLVGKAKQSATYPIHKQLHFQQSKATQHLSDINEWILEKLPLAPNGKVLDAGCGVGNTLLTFCKNSQMSGLGISLSRKEITQANAAAGEWKLHDRCQFKQQSFEMPFDQKFDTIIAIESLKHAPNLEKALTNLAGSLTENGCLIIVEDFGESSWKDDQNYQQYFLQNWSVNSFYTLADFTNILAPLLKPVEQKVFDFTPFMEIKPAPKMLWRFRLLQFLRPLLIFPFLKSIVSTFAGGFLLDYFYAKQLVKYQLLFLQKKSNR